MPSLSELMYSFALVSVVRTQFLGSSLYNALSGYGESDMCRYISCPFGQYCWNGNCISTGSLAGTRNLDGMGALTSAASLYGMNIGRGMYGATGIPFGGGVGGVGVYGLLGGGIMGAGANCVVMPSIPRRGGGTQPCSLMQQCFNGQICVNGFCSRSNVAYSGSQIVPVQTNCLTGAICPVGQYCINGVCMQNAMSTTFACQNGIACPPGMNCYLGRCISNGLPLGK
ncbi:hypothetical protein Angca_001509 [Angiostrongylus cantonensis]|nr:hypothetical protein Angca_001509 [Angiostrongylus cantonensis]